MDKVSCAELVVGIVALAVPVPGSCLLGVALGEKMLAEPLADDQSLAGLDMNRRIITAVTCDLVGKGAAIAVLSTLVALSVITGPVGIGFAIAGFILLGLGFVCALVSPFVLHGGLKDVIWTAFNASYTSTYPE